MYHLIVGCTFLLGFLLHDFHLSKTDFHYKSDEQALQVTVHIFIDDTEKALSQRDSLAYKLMDEAEHVQADSLLGVYLQEKIEVIADGVALELNYLGKEASDDIEGLYAYLEATTLAPPEELEIRNSILMEVFDDQKNIIKVMHDKENKAFHLLSVKDFKKVVSL